MIITLKTKIWLTVLSIVLMFSYFIFIYFPSQQEEHILENYTSEVQNIANTIGVGVEIAINEQNFRGITKELEIIKNDGRLSFVRLIEEDTVWSGDHLHYTIRDSTIFTFPEKAELPENFASNDSTIVKRVSLNTKLMNGNGAIMVGFKTNEIIESNRRIRRISIFISTIVFTIAILIGFWLSRNISRPVNALREATRKVGKGDFTQRVINNSTDEIGELSNSFNKMVEELARLVDTDPPGAASLLEKMLESSTPNFDLDDKLKALIEKLAALGLRAEAIRCTEKVRRTLPGMLDLYKKLVASG